MTLEERVKQIELSLGLATDDPKRTAVRRLISELRKSSRRSVFAPEQIFMMLLLRWHCGCDEKTIQSIYSPGGQHSTLIYRILKPEGTEDARYLTMRDAFFSLFPKEWASE